LPLEWGAGPLDADHGHRGQLRHGTRRRSIKLEATRGAIEELRAARVRLVLSADADRRTLERELHDGVHQHLVALAVAVQLARDAVESDAAAAKALLEEMSSDLQQALEATALLAQRIHPATLDADRLAVLLRAVAVNAAVPASVDVAAGLDYPPEVGMTVYLCWLEALARAGGEAQVSITVSEAEDALAFEVTGGASAPADLDGMRERVEALGGRLTVDSPRRGGTVLRAAIPRG
jgi:signal transduction histidine kinase